MISKISESLFERSQQVSPGGVHSPVRAFRAVGGSPIFFKKGLGSKLYDVDDNEYVDFCMCWGALSLGHAHKDVVQAIKNQAEIGSHYGTPTKHDVELAEFLLSKLRPFDRIRFVNSGTEAVMTAIRLSRGYTQKNKIVKIEGAYHGHFDALLVSAGSGLVTQGQSFSQGVTQGCVQDTLSIAYNSIEALEKVFAAFGNDIACIIVEPVMANNGLFGLGKSYLTKCREISKKYGALLIFDEVITGFRLSWGGAKQYYNIEPDLATYGKIIGGGLPVGAISGPKEILECLAPNGKVYQAGTLSGNPIAMRAGLATLNVMNNTNHYENISEIGNYLDTKIQTIQHKQNFYYKRIEGIFWICPGIKNAITNAPQIPSQLGHEVREAFKLRYRKILEKGVYLAPSAFEVGFISACHSQDDIDKLIYALDI